MTRTQNIKPKITMAEKTQYRNDNLALVLSSHFVSCGEDFSAADIGYYLSVANGIARGYLTDLVDQGKLSSRRGKGGTLTFARKPPSLLRTAWRRHSDEQIGLTEVHGL